MKNLLSLIIFSIISIHLYSQESYIQVIAEPGISVYLNGNLMGKTTAEAGGLMLEGLSKGRYAIKVVREGYLPQGETLELGRKEGLQYKVKPFVKGIGVIQSGGDTGFFTDERDRQTYRWVRIGTQVWMAENLNYVKRKEGWCYDGSPSNCAVYGRLYDWETAGEVCPEGWHLPDDREWDVLINYLGGESFAGRKVLSYDEALWRSPRVDATNESGLTVLPSGFRNAEGDFNNLGDFAYFWSSSDYGKSYAWFRYLGAQFSQVYRDGGLKVEGLSVRCVKD